MANTKLTDLTALSSLADADWVYVVDTSDTTDDSAGSSRKITKANLGTSLFNDVTVTGTFTSVGIDDNATAERLSVLDSGLLVGSATSGTSYVIVRYVNDGGLVISGSGSGTTGANINLQGSTHATLASDSSFRAGTNIWMYWDESVGDLEIKTGIGSKATALTIDASLDSTFVGNVSVGGYIQSNTSTTAALADVTDAINTAAGKIAGAMVYNTDTDNAVWAVGNADADIWVDGAGNTAHSPV